MTLDYSMMLTAPLRESLHWKSYKMPRPDQPDGLRRMPGPVAGLHGDRVGEPRHQARVAADALGAPHAKATKVSVAFDPLAALGGDDSDDDDDDGEA